MRFFPVYLLLALFAPGMAFSADYGDALAPLLEGEFALQQGQHTSAAQAYVRAAEQSPDLAVAERAVQVALAARDVAQVRQALARWQMLADSQPAQDAAWLRLALLESDHAAARTVMARLLQREEGWRQVAAALAGSQEPERASRLLGELLQQGQLPQRMEAWLAFGGVALRLKDSSLYGELAQAAAAGFPEDPRALAWRAEDAISRGDDEDARRALQAALALPDLGASERLTIAAQFDALGDPAAAAAALDIGLEDDRVLGSRAAYLARAEDEAGLAALYERAVAQTAPESASPARLYLLGQLAEMREDDPAALAWYRSIRGGLQRDQAQLRIAALLDKSGEHAAAQALLRQVQAGDSEWGDIIRDAYLLEAELARNAGDGVSELNALNRGLGIFEDDLMLRYSRALAFERMDRVEEAVADLRQLLAEAPDDADFLNALGYTLVDRTEAIDEGLELIEQAIARKPDSAPILDSLGWALHRHGRNAEALPHLKRAFELQRDAEIAAHLATVLWLLGQADEARSILRLGQEIDADNRALRRALEAVAP